MTKYSKVTAFTLIELIIVIVLIGILAATALPRFVDFSSDATINMYKNMAGSMTTSIQLMHNKWRIDGSPSGNYTFAGAEYEMSAQGYPTGSPTCTGYQHDCRCVWWRFMDVSDEKLKAASSSPGASNHCPVGANSYAQDCEFAATSASNSSICAFKSDNGTGNYVFTYDKATGNVAFSIE